MVTETENYQDRQAMRAAKLRTATRHQNGFRPIHSNRNNDGTWTVFWNNDPEPPSSPPRQLTQRQFLDEMAEERGVEII